MSSEIKCDLCGQRGEFLGEPIVHAEGCLADDSLVVLDLRRRRDYWRDHPLTKFYASSERPLLTPTHHCQEKKMKKRKFVVTVTGLDDISSPAVADYIREAVQCWGGQYSDFHGMDERYRVARSEPTVRSMSVRDTEEEDET